jgi:hypothetical protein
MQFKYQFPDQIFIKIEQSNKGAGRAYSLRTTSNQKTNIKYILGFEYLIVLPYVVKRHMSPEKIPPSLTSSSDAEIWGT